MRVSNIGEYRSVRVGLTTIGTPAHELAHNLGAQDMYSRYTSGNDVEPRWPTPRSFSLMCNGNHIKDGNMPTYIDPYQRIYFGWTDVITADEDGIYTLKSVMTGDRVLKVPTPNPDEYFLFEIRLKKGFEEFITGDESHGGVVVYHIDEGVNREWFLRAQCVSSNRPEGKRHDLGNALKPRCGMEEIKDDDGKFLRFGPLYSAEKQRATRSSIRATTLKPPFSIPHSIAARQANHIHSIPSPKAFQKTGTLQPRFLTPPATR